MAKYSARVKIRQVCGCFFQHPRLLLTLMSSRLLLLRHSTPPQMSNGRSLIRQIARLSSLASAKKLRFYWHNYFSNLTQVSNEYSWAIWQWKSSFWRSALTKTAEIFFSGLLLWKHDIARQLLASGKNFIHNYNGNTYSLALKHRQLIILPWPYDRMVMTTWMKVVRIHGIKIF